MNIQTSPDGTDFKKVLGSFTSNGPKNLYYPPYAADSGNWIKSFISSNGLYQLPPVSGNDWQSWFSTTQTILRGKTK